MHTKNRVVSCRHKKVDISCCYDGLLCGIYTIQCWSFQLVANQKANNYSGIESGECKNA